MTDLIRLMYDDGPTRAALKLATTLVATFELGGKTWAAHHVENPREFRGRGWFLSNDPEYGSGDHDLQQFLANPNEFAIRVWGYSTLRRTHGPGWTNDNGKFAEKRFNRVWDTPTFLRFEEVIR